MSHAVTRAVYYTLKPMLPWRIRLAARRFVARRIRSAFADTWPIDPAAATPPAGWSGWPDGHRFALVLTHDVEGPKGLANCRRLAEVELELGLRSCFNFVPEGGYSVPSDLRSWLTANGFEVGVHDLHHDGRLFWSRRSFARSALSINHYLRDWKASGFRAGFMLRRLDWYHDLQIEYDGSTFDTDPFEPQPEGVGTIFPFWEARAQLPVGSTNGRAPGDSAEPSAGTAPGYVELPYTLPQDSTLYLVLREATAEIWHRKLDWIVAHGGMALLNTHPDYICFEGDCRDSREYPAEHYRSFLEQLQLQYAGQFWNPLPRQLARWYRTKHQPQAPATSLVPPAVRNLRGRRAAVLLYSFFPSDPRPRRAAEAMASEGMEVDLLCLAEPGAPAREDLGNGLRIIRIPCPRQRGGVWNYFSQYAQFILKTFWYLCRHTRSRQYDLVHVHNMPDVLVFSALWPRLRGAKILLDLHDPMPELMMTIFGVSRTGVASSILRFLERCSIGFAHHVFTVNEACRQMFSSRSCRASKVTVIMNAPDEQIFALREPALPPVRDPAAPFVIMYHGSLVERHGLDLAVDALATVRRTIPGAELRVFGSPNAYSQRVLDSITDPQLRAAVHLLGHRDLEALVTEIRACDVGVIPNRRSIFTEINTPTRIFEYLSQGKPTIAPRSPGILDYFGPDDLIYFELGDAAGLAERILHVFHHPAAVAETVRRGQTVLREHSWTAERQRLLDTVGRLFPEPVARTGGAS